MWCEQLFTLYSILTNYSVNWFAHNIISRFVTVPNPFSFPIPYQNQHQHIFLFRAKYNLSWQCSCRLCWKASLYIHLMLGSSSSKVWQDSSTLHKTSVTPRLKPAWNSDCSAYRASGCSSSVFNVNLTLCFFSSPTNSSIGSLKRSGSEQTFFFWNTNNNKGYIFEQLSHLFMTWT